MVELVGLPVVTQGDVAGKTFGQVADAYQLAIVRKIWGDLNAKQRRAIRKVFLKVGKGNGKTTTAAFIALAHCMNLAMSGRGTRGLIQILSATIPAADLCFQHILSAVQADDELARQFKSSVAKRQIEHVSSGIKIEVSPARLDATVGRRPIMLLVDELHLCAIECRQFAQVLDQARKGGANWGDDFLEVAIIRKL
jgi:phage terminase large subunit-like protein